MAKERKKERNTQTEILCIIFCKQFAITINDMMGKFNK